VERILQSIGNQDNGPEQAPERIFIRSILVAKAEKDAQELQWLGKGSPVEIEKIKRYTIGEYLDLLKYTVEHLEHGR
jgi:hypothetical protein